MPQCLSEWWNGFGLTALVMVMNFISNLDSDDPYVIAKYLQSDYCFLWDDFESMEAEGIYCSLFLLELIVTTHLNNITACIEVPGWNTNAMVMGQDGEGVVALAAAAVWFTIIFFSHADKLFISWNVQSHWLLRDIWNSSQTFQAAPMESQRSSFQGLSTNRLAEWQLHHFNSCQQTGVMTLPPTGGQSVGEDQPSFGQSSLKPMPISPSRLNLPVVHQQVGLALSILTLCCVKPHHPIMIFHLI